MDAYDKINLSCATVFIICLVGISFFGKLLYDTDKRKWKAYENRINTHYVEVHFKNGDVKKFDKNIDIEIDSTKMFGKGQLVYSLHPSGTKIPFDIVEYAEVKEVEKPH